MDLVVKGRGVRIAEQFRRDAEHKLEKLARLEPRAVRVELELSAERGGREGGVMRLEATLEVPRRTFRATAHAPNPDVALDQVVARLERQVKDHHERRRDRILAGGNRLKSGRTGPEGEGAAG